MTAVIFGLCERPEGCLEESLKSHFRTLKFWPIAQNDRNSHAHLQHVRDEFVKNEMIRVNFQ